MLRPIGATPLAFFQVFDLLKSISFTKRNLKLGQSLVHCPLIPEQPASPIGVDRGGLEMGRPELPREGETKSPC